MLTALSGAGSGSWNFVGTAGFRTGHGWHFRQHFDANLAAAKDLRSGQIHVTTTAGVVALRGTVHDSTVASRAEAIAINASGVRGVKNDLRVSSSSS
jgi:BON domain